jgi:asparagine synthase (glutamine-hydrolysing)
LPLTSIETSPEAGGALPRARIHIPEDFGWSVWRGPSRAAWFKGFFVKDGRVREGRDAAHHLAENIDPNGEPVALGRVIDSLDGHFAFAVEKGGRILAAVDRIRSIPLFLATDRDGWCVLDRPRQWLRAAGPPLPNREAGLEVAMSGYCTGRDTLYANLSQLTGGELAVVGEGIQGAIRSRYYAYRAWELEAGESLDKARARLAEVTRAVFEKTAASLAGRPMLLPLSAGLDSRLVASAFHELGVRDLYCYAYGSPGNHEALASRHLADRLGFRWHFVPYRPKRVREFVRSDPYRAYMDRADSCASVPFLQDLLALSVLNERKLVPADAVVINGNSGDFITGGHIVSQLRQPRHDLDEIARRRRVLDAHIEKHFSLWRDLRTPVNDEVIRRRLDRLIGEELAGMPPPEADHGLHEFLECHARQGNFVVTGQRVYEHMGLAWRLPLWDRDYLDFWRGLPLAFKAGQRLYRTFLSEQNWGGVWDRLDYPKTVRPKWAAALRLAAKCAAAPLGQRAWQALDRRVFAYWTDILSTYATVPYKRSLFDRRGFRNAIALRAEAYLALHGRLPDGRPLD